jgi:hypothetical protein
MRDMPMLHFLKERYPLTPEFATSTIPDPYGSNSNVSSPDGSLGSALTYCVAAFTGIALFNSLELILLIFITFTRRTGLYFWSLLIASLGVLPYSLGFLLYFFRLTHYNYVSLTLVTIGWWPMVVGQSVVLYSRLHLIARQHSLLRSIRNMIIVTAVLFLIPTSTLTFLALGPPGQGGSAAIRNVYGIFEKIQMTGFCIQEFIISIVYMRETVHMMKLSASINESSKKVMWHLIWINALIIAMDVALLGIEYASLYTLETTLKGLVYSVKLRLEFAVLSQLVAHTTTPKQGNLDTNSIATAKSDAQDAAMHGAMSLNRYNSARSTSVPPLRRRQSERPSTKDHEACHVEDVGRTSAASSSTSRVD